MATCEECHKKLAFLECYRHPTLGKSYVLCSSCFDQVSESVAEWGQFVLSNSFNMNTPQSTIHVNWEKVVTAFTQMYHIFDNLWEEKDIDIKGWKK